MNLVGDLYTLLLSPGQSFGSEKNSQTKYVGNGDLPIGNVVSCGSIHAAGLSEHDIPCATMPVTLRAQQLLAAVGWDAAPASMRLFSC